jgi:hypothetical protein
LSFERHFLLGRAYHSDFQSLSEFLGSHWEACDVCSEVRADDERIPFF